MFSAYSFRPRAWVLLIAALACAAGIALGEWQARRGAQKRALGEQWDRALKAPALELGAAPIQPGDYLLKRVSARGRFLPAQTVFLDNRLRHGRAGYEVVTPLRLGDSGMHILVDRGWLAAPPTRSELPEVRTPEGEVRIDGIALEHPPRALEVGDATPGRVRQNVEPARFAALSGLRLQPVVIQQRSALDDGLQREWPRPDFRVQMHEAYALQWYSLAALAAILGIGFSFRKK